MPTYEFQCSECLRLYREIADFREQRVMSKCCTSIAIRRTKNPKGLPLTPDGAVDVRELVKPEPEEGPIDGGIPFGTVPGDEDYEDETGGFSIGEDGYIGPLP